MAKLTKPEWDAHYKACELVESDRQLTEDDKCFILDNWNPMATNNVAAAGAFFTPKEWAHALMQWSSPRGRVIDFCAGIGRLGFTAWQWRQDVITELVCVEINSDFVKVGRRVLP